MFLGAVVITDRSPAHINESLGLHDSRISVPFSRARGSDVILVSGSGFDRAYTNYLVNKLPGNKFICVDPTLAIGIDSNNPSPYNETGSEPSMDDYALSMTTIGGEKRVEDDVIYYLTPVKDEDARQKEFDYRRERFEEALRYFKKRTGDVSAYMTMKVFDIAEARGFQEKRINRALAEDPRITIRGITLPDRTFMNRLPNLAGFIDAYGPVEKMDKQNARAYVRLLANKLAIRGTGFLLPTQPFTDELIEATTYRFTTKDRKKLEQTFIEFLGSDMSELLSVSILSKMNSNSAPGVKLKRKR